MQKAIHALLLLLLLLFMAVSTTNLTAQVTAQTPIVLFPNQEEIIDYLQSQNMLSDFVLASNDTMGQVSNLQSAVDTNNVYVAWQADIDGVTRIFMSVSYDSGQSFVGPVQLSSPQGGDASNLQIAAINRSSFAIWQEKDLSNEETSVIVSSSMDSGITFRTYKLNTGDSIASNPVLSTGDDLIGFWIQDNPGDLGCGGTPDGEKPDDVNSTASMIICAHPPRW